MSGDAWNDLFNAFGSNGGTQRGLGRRLLANEEFLRILYSRGGFFSLVVDIIVDEMTRINPTITDDPSGSIFAYLQATNKTLDRRQDAISWARLFGGSLTMMLANDGRQIWRPLREDAIQTMEGLRVFDRFRVTYFPQDLYTDPRHPKFGQPEKYTISPWNGTPFKVHETRCLIMGGERTPDASRQENDNWDDSSVMRMLEELFALAEGNKDVNKMMRTFVTKVLGIPEMMKMIMEGGDGIDAIKDRIDLAKESLEASGFWLIDTGTGQEKGETFEKVTASITGFGDLSENQRLALSGVSRIPQTKLFGRSAAGMNATGKGDDDNFVNYIDSLQKNRLMTWDQRLVYVTMLAKQGPTAGKVLANWTLSYPSLKQLSAKEQAEVDNRNADTAGKLVTMGAVHPDEVRAGVATLPFIKLDDTKYGDPETRPRIMPKDPNDPEDDKEDKKDKKDKTKPENEPADE